MSLNGIDTLPFAFYFSFLALGISLILAAIRLLRGPSLCDRVVAFDLLTTTTISLITLYVMVFQRYKELDIALVVGLVAFLATVALGDYVGKKKDQA